MTTLTARFMSLVGHVLRRSLDEFRKLSGRTQALAVGGFILVLLLLVGGGNRRTSDNEPSAVPAGVIEDNGKAPITPGGAGADKRHLKLLTWNIAAINNNPFEYWLTMKDDPKYDDLMTNVEQFVIDPPPRKDQLVSQLFTQEMFDRLAIKMEEMGWEKEHVEKVREMYTNDWSNRKVITQFLKEPMIGRKRLISMPDRVTNTITSSKGTFYRPTPINCYNGPRFTTLNSWYEQWLKFMFETKVTEDGKVPAQLLGTIPRAKYPAVTEEEELVSLPLQTLVIGIFDGIQVRMLNQISGAEEWQNLRDRICMNLNRKKTEKTLGVLHKSYLDATIMFLQETAASFIKTARNTLGAHYHVVAPAKLGKNDQNSIILLNKQYFDIDSVKEVTSDALDILRQTKSPVVPGDLLAIKVKDIYGNSYFLASFHGDTNGLATIPVVKAVREVFKTKKDANERFIFGMDANTYEKVKDKSEYQDVTDFASFYVRDEGLTSCWGDKVNPKKHTTRNARTYMQPQLSKAASKLEIEAKGDANPKDFILFEPSQYSVDLVARDNTGTGAFVEGMVFPTLDFPSDHAILRTVLSEKDIPDAEEMNPEP